MGGAVSAGRNNNDLVDNLVSANYIRTPLIENVFRVVDRANYFLPQYKKNAYKDIAWKNGKLHLSAPCIYSEVMEGLCLERNLSFLNLGSGTGYLSTMAGLIIGSSGINHGVELYPEVIEYAVNKLNSFLKFTSGVDHFDFCEPKFIQGNCLCISPNAFQYDRVYCGGACPPSHINNIKNLIKVGGVLVMPVDDQLMRIDRLDENNWTEKPLLPVSFASLILPEADTVEVLHMIDVEPLSLQEICRANIRTAIRNKIMKQHPNLNDLQKTSRKVNGETELDDDIKREDTSGNDDQNMCIAVENRSIGAIIDIVLSRLPQFRHANSRVHNRPNSSHDNIEPNSTTNQQGSENNQPANAELHENNVDSSNQSTPSQSTIENETNSNNGNLVARIMLRKRNRNEGIVENGEDSETEEESIASNVTSTSPRTPTTATATKTKREKFDSGLGEEIDDILTDGEAVQEVHDYQNLMEIDSTSSSDETDSIYLEPIIELPPHIRRRKRRWRTLRVPTQAVGHFLDHFEGEDIEEEEEDVAQVDSINLDAISPYTVLMSARIGHLPLPQTLKNYVNYYKEF